MKKIKTGFLCMAIAAGSMSGVFATAQEYEEAALYQDKDVLMFGAEEVYQDSILQFFFYERDLDKREPVMPGLILSTSNNRFHFAVGGYVKLTTSYDFEGVINDNDFITSMIPVGNVSGDAQALRMDASTSMLSFKAVANTEQLGTITGYVSANFRGPDMTFHLLNAHVSFLGFTFGYAPTTLLDASAEPPTIDYEGPNAMTFTRNMQIRYTYNPSVHWQMAIAAERPDFSATYSSLTDRLSQRIPDIPVYVQYSWKTGSHVRVSGIFRDLLYRDQMSAKNNNNFAWGVQLSGVANIVSKLSFYWQGIYGEGIADYIQDLSGAGLDMVIDPNKPGKLSLVPAYGWYAGLQYNFTSKVYCSATYSQVGLDPVKRLKTPDMYKFSQYIVGNVFWKVTPSCQLGIEYLHGTRENMDKVSGKANRLQAMVQYNF